MRNEPTQKQIMDAHAVAELAKPDDVWGLAAVATASTVSAGRLDEMLAWMKDHYPDQYDDLEAYFL